MRDLLQRVFADLIEFAQRRDLEAERLDKLSDIEHARGHEATASIIRSNAEWERTQALRLRVEANEVWVKVQELP